MSSLWKGSLVLPFLAALSAAGCSEAEKKASPAKGKDGAVAVAAKDKKEENKAHDHSGWWCDEHGVPEAECSMCSAKVAAECKKKGDWCDKHDRAKSQCFICDPKLKEKYAALYRAKYGKEPPPIEDEEKDKKDDKPKKG
jgi:hypothetical protein